MTDLDELERLAREAGREMGLTDLHVIRVSERDVGWMVRLPDGTAFRGCVEEDSEARAWEEMGRILRDLGTSTRIHRDRADRAEAELEALRERVRHAESFGKEESYNADMAMGEVRQLRAELKALRERVGDYADAVEENRPALAWELRNLLEPVKP